MLKLPFKKHSLSLLLLIVAGITTLPAQNVWQRAASDITLSAETEIAVSQKATPFWLSANRYGLSGIGKNWGLLKAGIERSTLPDSAHNWRIGYGATLAATYNTAHDFAVQELYADFEWHMLRLSVGSKERASELKNPRLSTGGLTLGMNARPVPQVRFEMPDFWAIPGTKGWLSIHGHVAYGRFLDDKWQKDFHAPGTPYSKGVLFHSKAGFIKIGNQKKFPLTLTAGLEMATQFGGEAWNIGKRADDTSSFDGSYQKMDNGLGAFWNAFVPGGDDGARDGDYKNVSGNQVGSWHLSLDYDTKQWGARLYAEHFFEDHSGMFFLDYDGYGSGKEWNQKKDRSYLRYDLKDILLGAEVRLNCFPWMNSLVFEYMNSQYQSGPIYHDHSQNLSDHIGGTDNYYNHFIYGAWQHYGQAMGNPLFLSPIYNTNGQIRFNHNRLRSYHVGIGGNPTAEISYRLLFTHLRSLGTYASPTTDPLHANYFLLEAGYAPRWGKGFALTASFGTNGGDLLEKSVGGMLSLRWNGNINPSKKTK